MLGLPPFFPGHTCKHTLISPRTMMAEAQQTQYPLASLQTISQARAALEARLVGIDNDLELTQAIGLLFIKRQKDLSDAFSQLQTLDQQQYQQPHEDLPPLLREQLALIDKEFQEGQNGVLGLKGLIDAQLVRTISIALHLQQGIRATRATRANLSNPTVKVLSS